MDVSSDVFRLAGDSVQLDTQDPVQKFEDLIWVFNRTNNNKAPGYEGRVEFNEETYSLTLKNLQKTDSGLYEVRASGDEDRVVAEYRLSVLDPVDTPVLTPVLHQQSRGTCRITLTCRVHDYCISSSCYEETCEEKEVTSPGDVILSLSVSGSSIICNRSNPVPETL
ncbi:SLAM family member 9-like [Colossoma macropomum]|uniref:SLAM family member 9-like n=1 Tax=Colossoma macropomum TaxID=42526 RepID=UPI001864C09B|nr:SLAM family member 9-like [Colossoma macropomum]